MNINKITFALNPLNLSCSNAAVIVFLRETITGSLNLLLLHNRDKAENQKGESVEEVE